MMSVLCTRSQDKNMVLVVVLHSTVVQVSGSASVQPIVYVSCSTRV